MSDVLTVLAHLWPLILTTLCLGWMAVWAGMVTLEYRAARDARWDAEDAETFGPLAVWGPLDVEPADPTPLFTAVATQRLRDELDDEAATAAWLRGA